MNLKKIGKVFTSKFVGSGPSSYKKRIYRAAVSQILRNTVLVDLKFSLSISQKQPLFKHTTLADCRKPFCVQKSLYACIKWNNLFAQRPSLLSRIQRISWLSSQGKGGCRSHMEQKVRGPWCKRVSKYLTDQNVFCFHWILNSVFKVLTIWFYSDILLVEFD